jgi:hypothetical protein
MHFERASIGSGRLEIASSRMAHLWDALVQAYEALGFPNATRGDVVFPDPARILEPTGKLDSPRVLTEAVVEPASYPTVKRRLPAYAEQSWRRVLPAACAQHAELGPASLVLYDVSTLYFEPKSVTGSENWGSPRSADWTRRSRSGCSPTRPGSR